QLDKLEYQKEMRNTLQNQPNLDVKQGEVIKILTNEEKNKALGVVTKTGAQYLAKAVIITSGTYLEGKVIIGDVAFSGGPNGQQAAHGLSQNLREPGLQLGRFKTGTPARVDRRTIDFAKMTVQPGDADTHLTFSFMTDT